jgi:integrase
MHNDTFVSGDFVEFHGKFNNLICPPDRAHIEVFDPALKGFYVDVLASGRKSFRLRYRFNKKLRVVTLGDASVMSLDDARQAARAWQVQVKAGTDPQAPPVHVLGPTVASFFTDQYLPYIKSYKRSWDTDDSMMRNHLLPKLGHKHMGAISPSDVAVFVNQMRSEGYAPGTCNRALVLLRYGFTLAVRWKVPGVDSNPVKEVKNLRDDNKIERFLTNEQMVSLMAAVRGSESQMLQHIVLFLLYTGGRKREVLDAVWADVDWERKSWRIPKTKSGKIRHIPLSVGVLQLLGTLRDQSAPVGEVGHQIHAEWARRPIFANPKTGLPYVSFFYSWDAARKRAGLPDLRVHDLRHSFASFLVNAGRSLYEVQELLGHADIRTTSRYAHLSRERLFEAVESVPVL